MSGSGPVIAEVKDVRHSYDGKKWALKGVSFDVRKGEVFGLLGKNGAGKSTLIKVMTTLIRPSSGSLKVLGMDAATEGRKIRRRIGVVQQGESFDFATVEDNFDIYGMLWDIPKKGRIERRERLLKLFDLDDARKQRAFDLSGGQKRRLQVARELMHEVDILFLDEPTTGLDVLMRHSILDFVRAEVNKGLTVVFTTHNLEEADYLCDRIAVIDRGKMLALDTVDALKRRYGGKKTVEVTVDEKDAASFYARLGKALPSADAVTGGTDGTLTVLSVNPKETLRVILECSQSMSVPIDWLNVRKNTLEEVFLESLAEGED